MVAVAAEVAAGVVVVMVAAVAMEVAAGVIVVMVAAVAAEVVAVVVVVMMVAAVAGLRWQRGWYGGGSGVRMTLLIPGQKHTSPIFSPSLVDDEAAFSNFSSGYELITPAGGYRVNYQVRDVRLYATLLVSEETVSADGFSVRIQSSESDVAAVHRVRI